jgi:5'-nucleotidase (lipoprotein e(P4) family)
VPAPGVEPWRGGLALKWVRTSAEYRALALQVYAAASAHVASAAAGRAPRTWAVVLDADETILDNSLESRERDADGRRFEPATWAAFVKRRVSTAVPGAQAFLEGVRSAGGVIAVVTNRDEDQCEDTRENLSALRLPFDVVLCQPKGAARDKTPRFERVASGDATPGTGPLDVVAFVGDNILDFPGASQALRDAPNETLRDFGRRFFLLPNPVYGSWERLPDR